jgi:hypothetical protein
MRRNFQRAIDKYNIEAQSFDSADGLYSSQYIGQNGFVGENYANGQAPATISNQGQMFSRLSDGERTYTVVINNTNTSGGAVNAIIFGADLYSGNTQPNAGVTVVVRESSHAQARAQSQSRPFWINGLRYITTTDSQMTSQVPTVSYANAQGFTETFPFIPIRYRTAYNQIATQIDVPDFKMLVDGSTYWTVPVIANEQVTFIFQIGGQWDASKAVEGKSPFEVANQSKLVSGIGGSWK